MHSRRKHEIIRHLCNSMSSISKLSGAHEVAQGNGVGDILPSRILSPNLEPRALCTEGNPGAGSKATPVGPRVMNQRAVAKIDNNRAVTGIRSLTRIRPCSCGGEARADSKRRHRIHHWLPGPRRRPNPAGRLEVELPAARNAVDVPVAGRVCVHLAYSIRVRRHNACTYIVPLSSQYR